MRSDNITNNIKFAILAYIASNFSKFLVRIAFVKALPIEYLGINGLFADVINMLSLAEMGVGPAIVFSLYEPLSKKNLERIKELMQLFKRAYYAIGFFIILVGACCTPWIDHLIKDKPDIDGLNYIYLIFLLNTGVSYFYSYKRNLLIADQKQYIDNQFKSICSIILAVLQIISLMSWYNYYIYIGLMLLMTIIENYSVAKKVDGLYPFLNTPCVEKLPSEIKATISKNIRAMILHKLATIIVSSGANVILAKFVGIIAVGLYSNYYLVLASLNSFASQIFNAITASIGNLMVLENDKAKVESFYVTEFATAIQATNISICLYVLLNPLISLWLGKKFLLSEEIVAWMAFGYYLTFMRKAVIAYTDACGLYWQGRYKPVAEAIINIAASMYLTDKFGIIGVVWGSIISTALTCFWVEPYIVFRYGLKEPLVKYYKNYTMYMLVTFLLAMLTKKLFTYVLIEVTILRFILVSIALLFIINMSIIIFFRNDRAMITILEFLKRQILIHN